MLPILLGLGIAGACYLHHKKTHPAVANALKNPPAAPGQLTPERAAIHGELMRRQHDPEKLKKAAQLFGHEGLPDQARMLLEKAACVHQQMHGAKELVERSRAGDQHAMAMIKAIGEQAKEGSVRAQVSCILIEQYCVANPVEETPEKVRVAA